MWRIFWEDLCRGSMGRIYEEDLCRGSMVRINMEDLWGGSMGWVYEEDLCGGSMQRIYGEDLCGGSMQRIYGEDLCGGSMVRIYVEDFFFFSFSFPQSPKFLQFLIFLVHRPFSNHVSYLLTSSPLCFVLYSMQTFSYISLVKISLFLQVFR